MKTKLLRLMLVVAFGSVLLRGNQAAALTLNGDQSTDSTWDNYYFLIQNFSVADPVTITSLEIYSFTNATATYSVHYRAGDYLGFETDPNSWSQACSVVLAPPAPPALNLLSFTNGGVVIPPGETYAFMIADSIPDGIGVGVATPPTRRNFLNADIQVVQTENGMINCRVRTNTATSIFDLVDYTIAGSGRGFAGKINYYIGTTPPSGVIVAQPQSRTNTPVSFAPFSVGVSTPAGVTTYQWRRNGSPISGATQASYLPPIVTKQNDGDTYSVVVTANGTNVETSAAATLTVVGSSSSGDLEFVEKATPTADYNMQWFYLYSPSDAPDGNSGLSWCGWYSGANEIDRLVCVWDLSLIPANATVNSATIQFRGQPDVTGGTITMELHSLTNTDNINEATAHWHRKSVGFNWDTPGGDFAPAVLTSLTLDGFFTGITNWPSTPAMVAAAQSSITSSNKQFGLLGKPSVESGPVSASYQINTDNTSQVAQRPKLTLNVTLPGAGSPLLHYAKVGSTLNLTWGDANFVLQASSSLSPASWVNISSNSPTTITNIGSGINHFRLKQ